MEFITHTPQRGKLSGLRRGKTRKKILLTRDLPRRIIGPCDAILPFPGTANNARIGRVYFRVRMSKKGLRFVGTGSTLAETVQVVEEYGDQHANPEDDGCVVRTDLPVR